MEEAIGSSIKGLISRIDSALAEDDAELFALRKELAAKAELADFTLSQLHQAQQELQHYYLLCESQAEILDKSLSLLRRVAA